jgi:murein DD-endopeptidase MepM/ murein hydrolase activator NlpD
MVRALVVLTLVVGLVLPDLAQATSNGGVRAGDPIVVATPKAHKKKRRHHKRRKRHRQPRPAAAADPTHRFPVAGAFTWPGPAGEFAAGRSGHVHQGYDLLAADGTPVVAPYAGTVTFVQYQAKAAGYYVVLHSDYDYAFMHLAPRSTLVSVGQYVAAGQQIASVGHTGDAEGPHLHFEVWQGAWQQGGTPIDPKPLLQSWYAGAP